MIEEMIKTKVNYFSFPFGMYNKFIIEKGTELGYQAMFTTDTKTNDPEADNIILHRWSVKRNISNKNFSDIITKKSALKRKIFFSGLKNAVRNSIGRKYSDKLNIFIDSITKKQI